MKGLDQHMKKILLITIISAMLGIGAAYGQSQSLAFNDGNGTPNSGTYNSTDTITLDINLTFSGYSSFGLSFWLEASNGIAPFLRITSITYGTAFSDPTQNPTNALFNSVTGASPGFMTEVPDMGSTVADPQTQPAITPGTYLVAHITISLTNAPAMSFIIQSTTVNPHASEVSDTKFNDHNIVPAAQYFVIIPEPTTLALIGMTAVGGAFIAHRRRVLKG
jgi:hypothetical protein